MKKILIIADDLSGAADCAIGFTGAGHRVVVMLEAERDQMDPHADTTAVDTDTRRLSPAQAAARTAAAFRALGGPGQRLYKKIDSTLRGNWAAEVAALQPVAGLAIVAPAFPATGRALRGARVLVHGTPLEQTPTWQLENAGRDANVATLLNEAGLATDVLDGESLRDDPAALAARIAASAAAGTQALIVDTGSEQALRTLARVTLASDVPLFWVGSGGLAREISALTRRPAVESAPDESPAADPHADLPVLALVGSLSPVSERQCAMLRERTGIEQLIVPPDVLRAGPAHADWAALRAQIGATLAARADLLVRIGRDDAFDPAEGAQLSTALAALVEPHFARIGGLIATGGETARAMLSAARIPSLHLQAEVEAGVAVGRPLDPNRAHRPGIVTKAGAFGTDHALYAAWLRLRNQTEPDVVPH
ncbi:four-carbon acid sugar kinase family protein [Paraburkholderia caballeronis]|uniref:four-carbon acid sugar kinase family protein n=1 Tax=Paraburkholderia caballeronis TaxID=416943 RepID=UPI00106596A1|nr:four-carbon acid sugar kinase family protein [Paraburkholderia caballeronis]TDV01699.1 uncharacterized protein YgbK (DUF1537 family) [Paraburkholderia caballeronis]TDV06299.1 uncharacterized protein YgbK (DUF1537 family) [Paraburkholderia caballeronis]TDV16088.1 uncharacterized protein YgbK (DUF1537 family) [Paraburkholderia caballeronis]